MKKIFYFILMYVFNIFTYLFSKIAYAEESFQTFQTAYGVRMQNRLYAIWASIVVSVIVVLSILFKKFRKNKKEQKE